MSAILDHIVINTRFEVDRAEKIFADLGFTLTPRGYHTLGSHNHLMMFATDFLELVGIAEADAHKRPEIADAPPGLNGLVFKTDDAGRTFARLETLGVAGEPPRAFSRPVTLADRSIRDARFRTVTAGTNAFPGVRLYFCEHLTPDLVWRPEWQSHANGVTGFCDLTVVTADATDQAARLGALLDAQPENTGEGEQALPLNDGFRLVFLAPDDYAAQFGDMARSGADRDGFLGAAGLRCGSVDAVRRFAESGPDLRVAESGERLDVAVEPFDTLLCFRP